MEKDAASKVESWWFYRSYIFILIFLVYILNKGNLMVIKDQKERFSGTLIYMCFGIYLFVSFCKQENSLKEEELYYFGFIIFMDYRYIISPLSSHLFFGFLINYWYRDLLRELYQKYEVLLIMFFLLFLLFLVSEGLLFVSFFWTSFHSLSSPSSTGMIWF